MLEMEERVDINLTEGMSPSPPQPLSLDAALGNTNPPPPHPLTHFPSVRLARAAEPGQVDNSGKKKKKESRSQLLGCYLREQSPVHLPERSL